MKRLWIIVLMFILLLVYGCSQNESTEKTSLLVKNKISKLTEKEALRIIDIASIKYRIVSHGGYGIPNCKFVNEGPIEINSEYYVYMGDCIDTIEEFNNYLNDIFTKESIESIMDSIGIIDYKGKLLRWYADCGGGLMWGDAKIISLEEIEKTTEIEFKVPWEIDDTEFDIIKITFRFIENKGWRIDTDEPSILY